MTPIETWYIIILPDHPKKQINDRQKAIYHLNKYGALKLKDSVYAIPKPFAVLWAKIISDLKERIQGTLSVWESHQSPDSEEIKILTKKYLNNILNKIEAIEKKTKFYEKYIQREDKSGIYPLQASLDNGIQDLELISRILNDEKITERINEARSEFVLLRTRWNEIRNL